MSFYLKSFPALLLILFVSCDRNLEELKFTDNYLEGVELSKKLNRPILLYFWSHASQNERFFKDFAFSRKIQKKLNENYVLIALNLIDRRKLTAGEFEDLSKFPMREVWKDDLFKSKNAGNANTYFLISLTAHGSTEVFVIIESDGSWLTEPFQDVRGGRTFFLKKLEEGLESWKGCQIK